MSKNYKVIHAGGTYPVGTVVPAAAFHSAKDISDRLAIGSIRETHEPATVASILGQSKPEDVSKEEWLEIELRKVEGERHKMAAEIGIHKDQVNELQKQLATANATITKLQDQLVAHGDTMAMMTNGFDAPPPPVPESETDLPVIQPTVTLPE